VPVTPKARIVLVAVLAAAAVAVPVAFFAFTGDEAEGSYRGSTPPDGVRLPEIALPDDSGRLVDTSKLGGKVAVVTFLDTQCTESCPLIASHVGLALRSLSEEERRRVVALAVSVDPEEDTPRAVRTFLEHHRARGELHYLVAPEPELRPAWAAFGVLSSADSGSDNLHSAPVRIYDRGGIWVTTLNAGADLTPQNLAHDIEVALG
jgi:cytochrome oxidase Cu insertion factor (SCO1/SenC/PrrC family)